MRNWKRGEPGVTALCMFRYGISSYEVEDLTDTKQCLHLSFLSALAKPIRDGMLSQCDLSITWHPQKMIANHMGEQSPGQDPANARQSSCRTL